ncbi:hypothetical protein [Mycobacteroides franklinii]|uniref:DUF732 domain-containing protein n=1 Tax=Mycobacteroides franklinii TaxID=948102 RepID=A0A4R5PFK9_9MYCO|nr:hypothetical protein [Mycobacteroides franklinii]ORA64066.1 hypothetical protein BST24_02530 [Mycobacteroides franklinii]TDH23835.1 hypothetical protein EJ571_06205 [Mycobacteroides franklinii]TDZ46526.1 hypothetical protein CCUG64054_00346 [Mycobacteroides franklinii]TDZ48035.1 hypothetical protein CCUG63697_04330 [Mycobacteroides franklinii]TDZ60244.1 hypothetical protein CCUG63696_00349 [Mycobacteroides franklinii]
MFTKLAVGVAVAVSVVVTAPTATADEDSCRQYYAILPQLTQASATFHEERQGVGDRELIGKLLDGGLSPRLVKDWADMLNQHAIIFTMAQGRVSDIDVITAMFDQRNALNEMTVSLDSRGQTDLAAPAPPEVRSRLEKSFSHGASANSRLQQLCPAG